MRPDPASKATRGATAGNLAGRPGIFAGHSLPELTARLDRSPVSRSRSTRSSCLAESSTAAVRLGRFPVPRCRVANCGQGADPKPEPSLVNTIGAARGCRSYRRFAPERRGTRGPGCEGSPHRGAPGWFRRSSPGRLPVITVSTLPAYEHQINIFITSFQCYQGVALQIAFSRLRSVHEALALFAHRCPRLYQ